MDTEISKKGKARWHCLDNLLWKKLWSYRVTNYVVILMCTVMSVHAFTPHYVVTKIACILKATL